MITIFLNEEMRAGVAQSVLSLTTDWSTNVRSPAEEMCFSSSPCFQTSSEAHPAFYPMRTGGPISKGERGRGVTLTTHPLVGAIPSIPWCLHGGSGTGLLSLDQQSGPYLNVVSDTRGTSYKLY
jgi:hypothetical protein